ncbi:peptidase E [Cellulosimicrobium marinum]|uniref:Type 1 glutamine amidotransferase-like domain-containing protein n=1 Tax=Cellulosimicrobium marinum TaxID=1638992 RepID=UPI001E5B630F|nr:peptidase E [Cellulosimicrobium marinum]MCB7137395.1 peptidase E [Cellulosimicrobium marinum]
MGDLTILATSGGYAPGHRTRLALGPLVHHAAELSGAAGTPRVCHLGTAGGDQTWFHAELDEAARVAGFGMSHLSLFSMPNVNDVEGYLREQDVVWVGGGSVVNLLAVWRAHDLPRVLRAVGESGVVLAGVSAGSICWHVGGPTDSFGPDLRPVTDALAFVPFGNGVHYDAEPGRRPLLHRLVAEGALPTSYASDDGVGLVYRGPRLVEAVTERRGAAAWRVTRASGPDGEATAEEARVEPRVLPGAR